MHFSFVAALCQGILTIMCQFEMEFHRFVLLECVKDECVMCYACSNNNSVRNV